MAGEAGDLVRDGGVRSMTRCESTGAGALLYQSAGELSLDEAYGAVPRSVPCNMLGPMLGVWLDRPVGGHDKVLAGS